MLDTLNCQIICEQTPNIYFRNAFFKITHLFSKDTLITMLEGKNNFIK